MSTFFEQSARELLGNNILEDMPEGQRCCADKGFDFKNNRALLNKYNLKDDIQRKDKPN